MINVKDIFPCKAIKNYFLSAVQQLTFQNTCIISLVFSLLARGGGLWLPDLFFWTFSPRTCSSQSLPPFSLSLSIQPFSQKQWLELHLQGEVGERESMSHLHLDGSFSAKSCNQGHKRLADVLTQYRCQATIESPRNWANPRLFIHCTLFSSWAYSVLSRIVLYSHFTRYHRSGLNQLAVYGQPWIFFWGHWFPISVF